MRWWYIVFFRGCADFFIVVGGGCPLLRGVYGWCYDVRGFEGAIFSVLVSSVWWWGYFLLSVMCCICELMGQCVSIMCVVVFCRVESDWLLPTVLVGPSLNEVLLVVGWLCVCVCVCVVSMLGGAPTTHHDEKISASTEEDDIPPPHYNHGTAAVSHTLVTVHTYARSQGATTSYHSPQENHGSGATRGYYTQFLLVQ
jgi:hypothetical protein